MIQKVIAGAQQLFVRQKKQSSIPHDFEPVARTKQDEEKDPMFQHFGDNSEFSRARFDDDSTDDDSLMTDDLPPKEEEFVVEDSFDKDE
jgi:hypothetical protein